jgi:hypothetical protein
MAVWTTQRVASLHSVGQVNTAFAPQKRLLRGAEFTSDLIAFRALYHLRILVGSQRTMRGD